MNKLKQYRYLIYGVLVVLAAVFLGRLWWGADRIPQANYKLVDGSVLSTESLQNKVVVLSFWSTSCVACVADIPHLMEMHDIYREQEVEIIAVALSQDQLKDVVRIVHEKRVSYKVAYDAGGLVAQTWGGIEYTPTTFVVDRKGHIVSRMIGSQPQLLEDTVKALL